jgi:2-C-methyl-D-erythritol 4-phosphate cytidylyltransferase/2-C-methyl-D-erythritol 2,4-cyclodiphosphate synthase
LRRWSWRRAREVAGGARPKQFQSLGGASLLERSVRALQAHPAVTTVLVVLDAAVFPSRHTLLPADTAVGWVIGGPSRTASVAAGLEALTADAPDAVLIHDAARPGLSLAVIERLLSALGAGADGAAPALLIVDALKRCGPDGAIEADQAREGLMRVQTPQAFAYPAILAAYRARGEATADDDLALAARAGLKTVVVGGDHALMKATYPADFPALEALLQTAMTPRVGTGFDVHRFGPGDHVTLCGVQVALDRGLIGHSDADVAWHALTDALLGAIAAGDIGDHFPPSEARWKGAPSGVFLRHAAELVREAGGLITNVDLTIIGEKPRVKPHREAMRASTAEALGLPLTAVSVKATTTEGLGFTGREEGLAAQAVACVAIPAVSVGAKGPAD